MPFAQVHFAKSGYSLLLGLGTTETTGNGHACLSQVKFYNIENYSPGTSTAAAHTVVIDKCGTASLAPAASS